MVKPKTNRAGTTGQASKYDACQTPPYAVLPLLPYLTPEWVIWEPAAGEGVMVAALREHGFDVIASDILTGHNFFEMRPPPLADCQVTNPPYSTKYFWLARSYDLKKPFALLMPVEVLGAQSAQSLFKYNGIEVIFLDKRVDFKMPNKGWDSSAQFPTAWFTFGLNIGREMTFATLPKPNAQRRREWAAGVSQLSLFGS